MTIFSYLIIFYIVLTLFWSVLHFFCKGKFGKFCDKVNRIWVDWFEQSFICIMFLLVLFLIVAGIGFLIQILRTNPEG